MYSFTRPINLSLQANTTKPVNNVTTPTNNILTNVQNAFGTNQPIIFREPLPELPSEALTQDLLVLPKFDIKAPI